MTHLSFRIPGPAVGTQARARVVNRPGGKPYANIYTVKKAREYMATVTVQAQLAVLEAGLKDALPTDEALAIEIVAFFPRPKSVPLSRKWPIAKPDASNIQKAVEDALHRVVFKNDSHVVSIKTDKRYCVNGMEPHTRVEVWTAGVKRYDVRPRRQEG